MNSANFLRLKQAVLEHWKRKTKIQYRAATEHGQKTGAANELLKNMGIAAVG